MSYRNFTHEKLEQIRHSTREIAKDPYFLLTAYVLNALEEIVIDDEHEDMWGCQMPAKLCAQVVRNCIEDFKHAGLKGKTIDIAGKPYSIHKPITVNYAKVHEIFNFPVDGEDVTITENGVFNVKSEAYEAYEEKVRVYAEMRDYHRKVLMLASTDEGWDQLTDMEVAMYCWTIWNKEFDGGRYVNVDMLKAWWEKYYEYFHIPLKEITGCFIDAVVENENYNIRFPFSMKKVQEWHDKYNLTSAAINISDDDLEVYWNKEGYTKYMT